MDWKLLFPNEDITPLNLDLPSARKRKPGCTKSKSSKSSDKAANTSSPSKKRNDSSEIVEERPVSDQVYLPPQPQLERERERDPATNPPPGDGSVQYSEALTNMTPASSYAFVQSLLSSTDRHNLADFSREQLEGIQTQALVQLMAVAGESSFRGTMTTQAMADKDKQLFETTKALTQAKARIRELEEITSVLPSNDTRSKNNNVEDINTSSLSNKSKDSSPKIPSSLQLQDSAIGKLDMYPQRCLEFLSNFSTAEDKKRIPSLDKTTYRQTLAYSLVQAVALISYELSRPDDSELLASKENEIGNLKTKLQESDATNQKLVGDIHVLRERVRQSVEERAKLEATVANLQKKIKHLEKCAEEFSAYVRAELL